MTTSTATPRLSIGITTNTLQAGGAEKQRVLLANALARAGHEVHLYCLQSGGVLRSLVEPDVACVERRCWTGADGRPDALVVGTTNTENLFALVSVSRWPRTRWLTVVHNPMGREAPRLKRLSSWCLRLPDGVAALDGRHARELERRWGLSTDYLLSNGTTIGWAEEVRQARRACRAYRYDLGFLGRLSIHHKGLDRLLAALVEPPAAQLTLAIAGDGPDSARLDSMVRELGLQDRVTLVGHRSPADFFQEIAALALLSRYEGQPMVLLEAAAARVPAVISASAGESAAALTTTIPDDVGPDADAEALAAAASAAQQAPPAEGLAPDPPTVEEMADNYVSALRDLLAQRRRIRARLRRSSGARHATLAQRTGAG